LINYTKENVFCTIKGKGNETFERKKAQMTLMLLTEYWDKSVKGRMVYNGQPTREWLS
jgi:hypothetical protein